MRPRVVRSRTVGDRVFVLYECASSGDGLEVHQHPYNHLTRPWPGSAVEVHDGLGKSVIRTSSQPRLNIPAGKRHGIRGLHDRARFLNISPVIQ